MTSVPLTVNDFERRPNDRRLADLLAQDGPLALEVCLRYAVEIATALREYYEDGRAYGSLDTAHIVVRTMGATLAAPERQHLPDPLADVVGFGNVLFAMLNGRLPGPELPALPPKPALLKGPADVRDAAERLAERCLTADRETAPDLQKILTELRLLHVMAKQFSVEPPVAPIDSDKPAPLISAEPAPPAVESADTATNRPDRPGPPASRPLLKDVACPKCGSFQVRLSRPRTPFERFLTLFGLGIHRCHRCFYRYVPWLGRKMARHER